MTARKAPVVKIAPSLIAADFTRLREQVMAAEEFGADLLHIDVMDGRFVPNITLGPFIIEQIRGITKLPFDVHLMIFEPERHLDAFVKAGADRITIHYEATTNVHMALHNIKNQGKQAGIAINPHTPAHSLIDLMSMVDIINVMTVNPGFGGQTYLPAMTSKIARLRAMIGDVQRKIDLEVDGGINFETAPTVTQAGANVLIAGSYLFNSHQSIEHGIEALRQVLAD